MRQMHWVLPVACLAVFMAACDSTPPPLTEQEKQVVTELIGNMKPRCIGRYVIDMPNDLEESGDAKIQGVRIRADEMSEDEWRQEIAKRESDLRSTRSQDAFPFLYAAGKGGGGQGYYFVHRGTVFDDPSRRYIEGYKWNQGVRLLLKFEAYDYLHPNQTDDSIVKKMAIKKNFPDKLELVLGLMTRLYGRPLDEIPQEPAVCFPGGFLRLNDGDHEEVSVTFSSNRMQDLTFDAFTSTIPFNDHTTTAQHAGSMEARNALEALDGHDIRKGAVALPDLQATEWLFESQKPGGGRGHTFSLGANEISNNATRPYFSIEMSTGGQLKVKDEYVTFAEPSITTGEAVALWDAVTRTLRIEPAKR